MRHRFLLVLTTALAAGCGGSSSSPHFDGTFGDAWETLDAGPFSSCPGFTDYTPAGKTGFYAAELPDLASYTPADGWTSLTAPPADLDCWPSPAWVGDSLYVIRSGAVYAYDIGTDTWTTPVASGVADAEYAQMTHDNAGNVYAVESTSPYRVIKYNPSTKAVTYLDTGGFGTATVYEPRIAWDSIHKKLYIAPSYEGPELFSFDPAHPAAPVQLASVPNAAGDATGTGMGDPFCGDRSGHLYAIGDNGCHGAATVFQYDIATDTWKKLPDLPADHGCNGACTVSHDGWLYLTPGDTTSLYRIKLN